MKLVYFGAGTDLTPLQLADTSWGEELRNAFQKFEDKQGPVLEILDRVKTFVFVDSMPESRYFDQFCESDDHYVKYLQVRFKSECLYNTTHYPKRKLIYGKNYDESELYYYYNTDCQDPSDEPKKHYDEADVLYEHGFSLETGEPTPFPFIRMLPRVKHVVCQWDHDYKSIKTSFPHLHVAQTMFHVDEIARYVTCNKFEL